MLEYVWKNRFFIVYGNHPYRIVDSQLGFVAFCRCAVEHLKNDQNILALLREWSAGIVNEWIKEGVQDRVTHLRHIIKQCCSEKSGRSLKSLHVEILTGTRQKLHVLKSTLKEPQWSLALATDTRSEETNSSLWQPHSHLEHEFLGSILCTWNPLFRKGYLRVGKFGNDCFDEISRNDL